ncbi:MAG: lipoprotein-releasing ABC transporter permease subunit [Ectothiorhodospiraceae bacterium]|nr:lipoprotein-releasing ABC transporter permease subunit [Ectothiorhodospiraceae bacterium]
MFTPLELNIGLRYLRAKRRNQFISFISFSSMMGITLGVMALITVLSVMNGFEKELRERILGMASHITISRMDNEALQDWAGLGEAIANTNPRIVGMAPYVRKEVMFSFGSQVQGGLLRGVSPEKDPEVSDVWQKMLYGELSELRAGEFGIILGKGLARKLGVTMNDKVTVVTPQASNTPAGILPRMKRFTVKGIFEVGMHEYDSALSLIHVDDAARLFRLQGGVTGLRLKLDDMFEAVPVRNELVEILPGGYWISDWTMRHANLFRAVKIEKTMMFIILLLIVAVAAFNIVSTLVMVVTDKQADIAILRTLGSTPGSIMTIFIVQGVVIGVVGVALGVVAGVSLSLNLNAVVGFLERVLEVQFMPADVYYISTFPSELYWRDVIKIALISLGLSVLGTLYPAWRASRIQPAEALRYE